MYFHDHGYNTVNYCTNQFFVLTKLFVKKIHYTTSATVTVQIVHAIQTVQRSLHVAFFSIFYATDIGLIVISRLIFMHFHNQLNSKILICNEETICSNSFLPYTDNNLIKIYYYF